MGAGMASIGVNPPESAMSGGLTKNSMSWAWVAERAIVATKVPMAMPVSTQQAQAVTRSTRLPPERHVEDQTGHGQRIKAVAATREQFRTIKAPSTPVTVNHVFSRPGL